MGKCKTKILPKPVPRAAVAYGRQLKIELSTLTCCIFDTPLDTGSCNIIEKLLVLVNMNQEGQVFAALETSFRASYTLYIDCE